MNEWVLLETTPMVFVDEELFRCLGKTQAIDFDFSSQEFIVRKDT